MYGKKNTPQSGKGLLLLRPVKDAPVDQFKK
jgi:hypothetical protein